MNAVEKKTIEVMEICERRGGADWIKLRELCEEYLDCRRRVDPAEQEARKILLELGAPDHLVGHNYVLWAVSQILQEWQLTQNLSHALYPQIALRFGSTPQRVERSVRHLVEVTWTRGDEEILERYFGRIVNADRGKPTNGEFLTRLANEVRHRLEKVS